MAATSVASHNLFLHHHTPLLRYHHLPLRPTVPIHAFGRSDFDRFARRLTSGEALRNTFRNANNVLEILTIAGASAAIIRLYRVSPPPALPVIRFYPFRSIESNRKTLGLNLRIQSSIMTKINMAGKYKRTVKEPGIPWVLMMTEERFVFTPNDPRSGSKLDVDFRIIKAGQVEHLIPKAPPQLMSSHP